MSQLEAGYGFNNTTKKFVTADHLNSQVTAARLTSGAVSEQVETFTTEQNDSLLLQRETNGTSNLYKSKKSTITNTLTGDSIDYTNVIADDVTLTVENSEIITNKSYTTNGTTVTVNNVTNHNLLTGNVINVTATGSNFSGQYGIVVTSPTTFTYNIFSSKPIVNGTLSYSKVASLNIQGNEIVVGNLEVTGQIKGSGVLFKPQNFVPAGAVMSFAMSTAPSGWLECNGDAISRTDYADLFAAIGTTFGNGNTTTTFNLPDLRGEFIRGWDHGRTIDNGRAFGSSQTQQLEKHKHISSNNDCRDYTGINGVGTGNYNYWCDSDGISFGGSGASLTGDGTHVEQSAKIGTETRPRNIALMYCIKI